MDPLLSSIKQTYESASLSSLILIELLFFAICLHWCLPQRHRQAKTVKLATSTEHVWKVILDIHRYPQWRSHVVSVQPLMNQQHQFLEHVARTRQHLEHKQRLQDNLTTTFKTRVRAIDMNRVNETTLIRTDRRCTSCKEPLKFPRSSFEREWEIHVRPADEGCLVTLVETVRTEGYLARWLGPIFGGFHRVSQRFLLDLAKEIERQHKQRVLQDQSICESPVALQKTVLNDMYTV
ncbi:hypothetical protein BJV82DRAFT_175135 [Fennellomyces sp. T-0311]|nr:hypothetical protein BJV82DRAFT_175135 [Fennellomyces sp. T-0311]